MARPLVLHVAEAFSSGVAVSIHAYVDATRADVDSIVCGYRRPGVQLSDSVDMGVPFIDLPDGHLAQWRAIRRLVDAVSPDVVHLYSSWAGLVGRLPRLKAPRTVFTPQCFGFERQDLSPTRRRAVLTAERLCARSTDAIVTCSEHETTLARRHRLAPSVLHAPQVLPIGLSSELTTRLRPTSGVGEPPLVASSGRIAPQKDPDYFAEVVRVARRALPEIRFRWIGGGNAAQSRTLTDLGVEVTGWVPQHVALDLLAASDVYLHTAAWEGYPFTVLEAAALRRPIVARGIPALRESDIALVADEPAEVARLIVEVVKGEHPNLAERAHQVLVADPGRRAEVRDRLLSAYTA